MKRQHTRKKLDLQLSLPCNKSTDGKKRTSELSKRSRADIGHRLQLMKQDLEKAENVYLSSFNFRRSRRRYSVLRAAAHGDPNGKNDYQKRKVFQRCYGNALNSLKNRDVSSDNHSLIPCPEVKWIRNIDLSEQQEALMVVLIAPNRYKQAIRSRDASKWHDAMDKEINVMMERKVWDLVDHPII
ncbi:hypothetical protein TNCV_1180881 [Trichonephila clavipes]|nr:hypothetical protein TNCV_1180881 [Trichonephila clavipes]